jgi:hypothetical protein
VSFRIDDPKGDDHGSGALLYPNRGDMQRGDLDLAAFSARNADDGTWFQIEFARPIRSPRGEVTQVGQMPIEKLARHGSYTFNVDIYIDLDRIAGSGRTETVPGRQVAVDRLAAWEKAVIVSPRPDIARALLELHLDSVYEAELRARTGRVGKEDIEALRVRSQAEVAEHYFFPDRIRVRGRVLEAFVPAAALSGRALPSWSYTVFVTGADIEQLGRVGFNPTGRPKMMTMPIDRGRQSDAFGLPAHADLSQAPVVDVLAPEPGLQERLLDDYDVVSGRLAALRGVTPDGSESLGSAAASVVPEHAAAQPPHSGGAADAPPPTAVRGPRTVPARLRTLNQLLEEGLITEQEYGELRRKILAEI